jgi:hypothetical protein
VRELVLPHWHHGRAEGEDVGRLADRVEREAEGVLVAQPLVADFRVERRVAHHPVERDEHRKEKRQLVDGRHFALDEHRAAAGVDADGQPVGGDVDHALADLGGAVGAGSEGVLVGDEEVAVVRVLERQPVFDAADVMAEVELPGGRVAGEDAGAEGRGRGHGAFITKA